MSSFFFLTPQALPAAVEEVELESTSRELREVEVFGLDQSCANRNPVFEAEGADRQARGIFGPIVVLSKVTVNSVFTAVSTASAAATASITFAGCTPTDASSLIGPSCT